MTIYYKRFHQYIVLRKRRLINPALHCSLLFSVPHMFHSAVWPGEVAVCTRTWGGDSQGTGQEMWQYSQRPGRRQSGHWPGDVAVLTGTWGGDSQGTGQKRLRYAQGPGEETVRALARRCGSTHRDLGRRQSGHWPGDVAELTGTWGGDSQYAQGPGEETVRALARRCGRTHRTWG